MFGSILRSAVDEGRASDGRWLPRRGLRLALSSGLVLACACTELASPAERGLELAPSADEPVESAGDGSTDVLLNDAARGNEARPVEAYGDAGADSATPAPISDTDASVARDAGGDAGDPPAPFETSCPSGLRFGQSCYRPSQVPLSWDDARTDCLAGGADLVSLDSVGEDAFVGALLDASIWLGATDRAQENDFTWTDGRALSFSSWGPGQPDSFPGQNCVEKREEPGEAWYDQSCDNLDFYVCERPLTAD
jgi:lectin-like protein